MKRRWVWWDRVQRPLEWLFFAFVAYVLLGALVFGDSEPRDPAPPTNGSEVSYR